MNDVTWFDLAVDENVVDYVSIDVLRSKPGDGRAVHVWLWAPGAQAGRFLETRGAIQQYFLVGEALNAIAWSGDGEGVSTTFDPHRVGSIVLPFSSEVQVNIDLAQYEPNPGDRLEIAPRNTERMRSQFGLSRLLSHSDNIPPIARTVDLDVVRSSAFSCTLERIPGVAQLGLVVRDADGEIERRRAVDLPPTGARQVIDVQL